MKKICIALLASLACLFVVSCERQEDDAPLYSTNKFRVEAPQFIDENGQKVYLHYTDLASSLIYEEGDHVYINGKDFTLNKDGSTWYANSVNGEDVVGKRFLVAYADGDVNTFDSSSSTYHFNLMTTLSSRDHNKVVLGGVANVGESGYVITLQPACAILRINTGGAGASWTYAKVGFDANVIPKEGTLNVSDRTISASGSNFLTGVTAGGAGQFLNMRYSDPSTTGEDDYWYVAIPIKDNSVTTTLYLEWNNGSETIQHRTQAPVTLQKGYVYTLGTDRQSPFYANGSSKSYFQVSPSLQVRFSAGNLQYTRYEDPGTGDLTDRFRFANTQYAVAGEISNNGIGPYYQGWIDLFGWGTSGWNSGGGAAYEPYATTGTFKPGGSNDADLLGTYANSDWGVYNGADIYYGSAVSGLSSWRTLTDDEWNYLLTGRTNAASKYALATINGAYKGLILLPESWTLPAGLTFTPGIASGYSTNTYSLEDWDKMEMAGAIFLPAAGSRNGTNTSDVNVVGFYWSATHKTNMQANSLHFASSTVAASTGKSRGNGCSVRLVKNR